MAQQSRVGELLAGKYRLDTLLGSGGVGDVYRAQNTLIGRTVAIKLLKPEHVTDDNVVTRFLREAKAANLARHPNVVDVLDVGRDEEGIPFIVQEFLEGIDLGEKLRQTKGPLPSMQVLDLMIPVVQAVGLAHARGVVHRDLKPENVFLAIADGKVIPKLLDFGISYVKPQPGDIRMTKTGMTVGTPAYMSPEQLEGTAGVDVRTDVWALGVILYEALAGRLPFEGETSALMFAQIAWVDPTPLQEAAPYVPKALAQVVGRCLKRRLQDRYPSAAELARDLGHVREGRPIEPTHRRSEAPPPPPSSGASIQYEPTQVATLPPISEPDIVPVAESIESPRSSMQNSGIALATLRPPPGPEPEAPAAPEETNIFEVGTGAVVFVALALLTAGLWMTLVRSADGWPANDWLGNALGGPGTPASLIVALASVGGAGWIVTHMVRGRPQLWGASLSVLGLALFALPVVSALFLGNEPVDNAPGLWGWSAMLTFVGAGLAAAHQAWATWSRGDAMGRVLGIVLVVAGTTALLIAFEIVRAVAT